ncbi:GNAT family N-acetyltransferase [Roseibium sp. TrichSKD4]|uniref:GNAT family N-acetyltransferase n=1 Tax=Roseibium sp. TrichSKD4 TaxID=744980 RepID=UPI00352932FF
METDRLILRPWQEDDLDDLAALCSDPDVMRHFPMIMSYDQSKAYLEKILKKRVSEGFCMDPIIVKETGEFAGFVGLNIPAYKEPLPFDPCVEIGWRLHKKVWGKGYATEAANAWLRFGFETLNLPEIVAFTIPANTSSQRVMERLGMIRDIDGDFQHPNLALDHPMSQHVLYRLSEKAWRTSMQNDS